MRYEDLEAALKRQPLWEPPAGFARMVASRGLTQHDAPPATEHRPVFDFLRGAEVAVVSAAWAYAAAWILWRVTPLLTDTLVANAIPVAWTCAALSLSVAASFIRRAGVWT